MVVNGGHLTFFIIHKKKSHVLLSQELSSQCNTLKAVPKYFISTILYNTIAKLPNKNNRGQIRISGDYGSTEYSYYLITQWATETLISILPQ